jgi:hypothetical protein
MANPRSAYGPCFVCSHEIHISQFECGHVISHANGGAITVENLRPICGSCNKSMGARNLIDYKAEFFSGRTSVNSQQRVVKASAPKEKPSGLLFWPFTLFSSSTPNPTPPNPTSPNHTSPPPNPPPNPSKVKPSKVKAAKVKAPKVKPSKVKAANPSKAPKDRGMDDLIRGFVDLSIMDGCKHVLLSGQRNGQLCGKAVKKDTGGFCYDHDPTNPCSYVLVSGKRRGEPCGKPARNGPYCYRHTPENLA